MLSLARVLQAEAERRKRASVLESEGVRQSKINVAEADKQQVRALPDLRRCGHACLMCPGGVGDDKQQVRAALAPGVRVCGGKASSRCALSATSTPACAGRHAVDVGRAGQAGTRAVCTACCAAPQVILASEASREEAINKALGEAEAIQK